MENKTCIQCGAQLKKKQKQFCSCSCRAKWFAPKRPVTDEWLIDCYNNRNMTANDIAREIKKDPKTVWTWLKQIGVQLHARGICSKGYFKKGHIGKSNHKPDTAEKIRQARLRDGGVPYLQNGQHWLKGKPKGTVATWKGGITPERQAFYSTEEWINAVKSVWRRDDAICRVCGIDHRLTDKKTMQFHIHHLKSFMHIESRAEVSNLILVCKLCHKWIHSKKNINGEWIK